jgi:hypothetical protein
MRDAAMSLARVGPREPNGDDRCAAERACRVRGFRDRDRAVAQS